jgi:hypothetical protein
MRAVSRRVRTQGAISIVCVTSGARSAGRRHRDRVPRSWGRSARHGSRGAAATISGRRRVGRGSDGIRREHRAATATGHRRNRRRVLRCCRHLDRPDRSRGRSACGSATSRTSITPAPRCDVACDSDRDRLGAAHAGQKAAADRPARSAVTLTWASRSNPRVADPARRGARIENGEMLVVAPKENPSTPSLRTVTARPAHCCSR